MPLASGNDRATISRNIREMMASGHPRGQAIAAALHNASRYASGGAPHAPSYATAPAAQFSSAGLIPTSGSGAYQLDPETGALTPGTLANLQTLAQRGLTIGPQPAPPPPPPSNNDIMASALTNFFDPSSVSAGSQKRGGRLAAGGVPSASQMAPWFVHRDASEMTHPRGLVASATPGRHDVIPLSVASGSYVVPADVVSGISEGNTLAGARHLEAAMHTGPGGLPLSHATIHSTIPHPPSVGHLAHGGMADGAMPRMVHPHEWATREVPGGIPVIVAGGEFIYGPDDVRHIGDGDLTRGHDKLDQFVLHARAKNVRQTAKLPGPKKGNEH